MRLLFQEPDDESNCFCEECDFIGEVYITYDWSSNSSRDLDTATSAFGETGGYSCGDGGKYVAWQGDNTGTSTFEKCFINVGLARKDNVWQTSCTITCKAGWYAPADGSGGASLIVQYKGETKTIGISPGRQSDCASTVVGTVTVYTKKQPDGSYFTVS
jgi:hypothetical protein